MTVDDSRRNTGLTYRDAGVDIDRADALVRKIKRHAAKTPQAGVLEGVGGFASLFSLSEAQKSLGGAPLSDPVLVSGTDGVGTKLKLARMVDRHDTIGIDLVAMCVNDVLTTGARPLFFLDYLATGRLEVEQAEAVVRGVAEGCRLGQCALVGGETAEMPGLYPPGEYDLAGFAVGVVERDAIVDGRSVAPGDLVIGLASHGLHSNGFSLAHRVFWEEAGLSPQDAVDGVPGPLGAALLTPTALYTKSVQALMRQAAPKALAHITGGGIPGNLVRVLPEGCRASVDVKRWSTPPLFAQLARLGNVDADEMFRTFNMGIGFIAVVDPENAPGALEAVRASGETAWIIGEIGGHRGEAGVDLVGLFG